MEEEIVERLKNFVEIKPNAMPVVIDAKSKLFVSATLTDKNDKDILVYILIDDLLGI